jgi:cell division protein FtsW (lipid II flippase)
MNTNLTRAASATCRTNPSPNRKLVWLCLGVVGMLAVVLGVSDKLGETGRLWPYLLLLACPLMHLFMCRGKKQQTDAMQPGPVDRADS